VYLAVAQGDLGLWLLRRGDSAAARDLLDRARETFTRLRARAWLEGLDRAARAATDATGIDLYGPRGDDPRVDGPRWGGDPASAQPIR
jgi:hypothetical protein